MSPITHEDLMDLMNDIGTIILGLAGLAVYLAFWMTIFGKAGYDSKTAGLMALAMVVPLVNLALLIWFATTTWPVQRSLAALRAHAGVPLEGDSEQGLAAASRLEAAGDAPGALAQYEAILRTFPDSDAAKDAEASIRKLRATLKGT